MFINHIRVALRNLKRQPGFASINIFGLAIGLACCLLIIGFIRQELSFDQFHDQADRIYRVHTEFVGRGSSAFTDGVIWQDLMTDLPEVAAAARLTRTAHLISNGERSRFGDRIVYTDSTFFDVFDGFRLMRGDPETALEVPGNIILTETMARFWFGQDDPMGRMLTIDNEAEYLVTGILEDVPQTSHYQFEAISTIDSIKKDFPWYDSRGSISLQTYALLRDGADIEALRSRIPEFADAHYDGGEGKAHLSAIFFPMTDIHLLSQTYEIDPQGDIRSIYLFATIAIFILGLACINYMNLSTARAIRRAREVGIRKSAGARRGQLVAQFLTESALVTFIALAVGLGLAHMAVPWLSGFASLPLSFSLGDISLIDTLVLFAGGLGIAILAGSYPAFYLSRFNPVLVLKGTMTDGRGGAFLRRGLVVVQFSVSVILLAATFVVQNQLDFMNAMDLGFEKENVVDIPLRDGALVDRAGVLRDELTQVAGVLDATISTTSVSETSSSAPVRIAGTEQDFANDPTMGFIFSDDAFIRAFDLDVLAGRNLRRDAADDTNVLITAQAARSLGFDDPAEAIGAQLSTGASASDFTVAGVIEDFHIRALTSGVVPLIIYNAHPNRESVLSVRLAPGDQTATLRAIREAWTSVLPEWPFEYVYLEDMLRDRSFTTHQTARLFGLFSFLAVLIGCMGLLGLASFMAERRTKEIGIRKVLGATASQIVVLLSKEFTLLVLVSLAVAAPVVYFGMNEWLSDFVYRIDVPWTAVAWAGGLAILFALGTTSFQALRAAALDPARTLRME